MTGPRWRLAVSAAAVAVALAAAAAGIALFDQRGGGEAPAGRAEPRPAAPGETPMSLHDSPQATPELRFEDGDGRPLSLDDFRGKLVLLNLWATWCVPCREEMPTLDRLQAELGGTDFEVVALSIDRGGAAVVTRFYEEIGMAHLARYVDESGKTVRQLAAPGLPTTLLIDREGREIGRHVGPATWDSPAMVTLFERQLARRAGDTPSARNEGESP